MEFQARGEESGHFALETQEEKHSATFCIVRGRELHRPAFRKGGVLEIIKFMMIIWSEVGVLAGEGL